MAKRALYDLTLQLSANAAELKKGLDEASNKLNRFEKTGGAVFKGMKTAALGLVAALGVAGIGGALKQIMESTDATADLFEKKMAGIKGVASAVAENLANLDFSVSLKEAFKAAQDYADALDYLDDRRMGIDIISAKNATRVQQLRNELRDSNITRERAVEIEKELKSLYEEEYILQKQTANDALTAIEDKYKTRYQITTDEAQLIKQYLEDLGRMDKITKGNLDNAMEAQREYEKWYSRNSINIEKGLYDQDKRKKLEDAIVEASAQVTEEYKKYIPIASVINGLTTEQREEIKNIIVDWEGAQQGLLKYEAAAIRAGNVVEKQSKKVKEIAEAYASIIANWNPGSGNMTPMSTDEYNAQFDDDLKYGSVKDNADYIASQQAIAKAAEERAQRIADANEKETASVLANAQNYYDVTNGIVSALNTIHDSIVSAMDDGSLSFAEGMNIMTKAALSFVQIAPALIAAEVLTTEASKGLIGVALGIAAATTALGFLASIGKKENKYASGTNYSKGGWALVGENGPERVFLPTGSIVDNAAKTKRALSANDSNLQLTARVSGKDLLFVVEEAQRTKENSY